MPTPSLREEGLWRGRKLSGRMVVVGSWRWSWKGRLGKSLSVRFLKLFFILHPVGDGEPLRIFEQGVILSKLYIREITGDSVADCLN